MIPLSIPNFEGNELKYVTEAVAQGWVSTGGAYITQFEEQVAKFLKVPRTVACQSGTAALHLSLLECGVEAGDLVIAPTLTFIAAVNPIRYMGADPIFMDCDDSLCIDPVKLRLFCENECELAKEGLVHKKTKKRIPALVVVHVFGNMADMEQIMEIADEFRLKVVEDATEALGTRYTDGKYAGKYAGTIGDFGAYSFNGNKIITTGGGGMVVAKDPEHLQHIWYLSTQAKDDPLFYVHNEVGYNYRMTNVQAAIGVAQMEELPLFIERKRNIYNFYEKKIRSMDDAHLLPFRKDTYANCWFYAVYIDKKNDMKELVRELAEAGVQTRLIWALIHLQKPYLDSVSYEIVEAKRYSEHIINIPCSTNLTEQDAMKVCDELKLIVSRR